MMMSLALPERRLLRAEVELATIPFQQCACGHSLDLYPRVTLPLFITKASLELMVLASFLLFLMAIVTVGTLRRIELESTGWMRYAMMQMELFFRDIL